MKKLISIALAMIMAIVFVPFSLAEEPGMCKVTFVTENHSPWFLCPPDAEPISENLYDEYVIEVESGYTITEEDIPGFYPPTGTLMLFDEWQSNPVGAVITEDITFVAYFSPAGYVFFCDFYGEYYEVNPQVVRYGKDAVPPELPEVEGYVFAGWEGDYTNIKEYMTIIHSIYYAYGDANMDHSVNTGDAALILTIVVQHGAMSELQSIIADINHDNTVNTGDAAALLKMLV